MGWNSWDSFDGSPTEEVFEETLVAFSKYLAPHGYEYLVIVSISIIYYLLFILNPNKFNINIYILLFRLFVSFIIISLFSFSFLQTLLLK